MGKHMSGVESCASIEPSTNSTIEWTTLCGCTTTETRPISTSNSQRASIISSPLLNSVAESIVILRPITHEGCLRARSTVMLGNSSFGVVRNGPPEAVSQSLRTEPEPLPSRHWKIAECSLSTASTRAPCLRASLMTISPAMTRISLEATAMSFPARKAARAGCKPAVPTIAISTMSAAGNVASSSSPSVPENTLVAVPSASRSSLALSGSVMEIASGRCLRVCSRSSSTLLPAASPSRRIWSGKSSATLMVLVPIEPVLPSKTTFFMEKMERWSDGVLERWSAGVLWENNSRALRLLHHSITPFVRSWPGQHMPQVQIHNGSIKQQAVQQVEDAADAREELSRVLDACFTFEEGFNQIAYDRADTQDDAEDDRVFPVHTGHLVAEEVNEDQAGQRRDHDSAGEAFPSLPRADARNHLVPSNQRTDGVSAGVAEFRDEHEIKQVVMALHPGEEIDLLDKIQQPRDVHQAEQRRGNRQNSSRVTARKELAQTQPEHEEDKEAGLEIIDARGGIGSSHHPRQIQKGSYHQERPAKDPPPFETH